ncbi:hypothetical protein GGR50DRAFT_57644 [Xylaria sp. CBS 124048]|nr:hypothetical protein GGR50DRAFT_57644 [Xylaria sp. CBS 124048]
MMIEKIDKMIKTVQAKVTTITKGASDRYHDFRVELRLRGVRKIIRLNHDNAFRAQVLRGRLHEHNLDIDLIDIDQYIPAGTMPSVKELKWLKKEEVIQNALTGYIQDRAGLSAIYEQKYWHVKDGIEADHLRTTAADEDKLKLGIYGDPEVEDAWTNCPRVWNLREGPTHQEPRTLRTKVKGMVGRIGKKLLKKEENTEVSEETQEIVVSSSTPPAQPLAYYCGVCYLCKKSVRRHHLHTTFQAAYYGHYDMAKAAFDKVRQVVGDKRIRWKAPYDHPARETTTRMREIDAFVYYMWADREDYPYLNA